MALETRPAFVDLGPAVGHDDVVAPGVVVESIRPAPEDAALPSHDHQRHADRQHPLGALVPERRAIGALVARSRRKVAFGRHVDGFGRRQSVGDAVFLSGALPREEQGGVVCRLPRPRQVRAVRSGGHVGEVPGHDVFPLGVGEARRVVENDADHAVRIRLGPFDRDLRAGGGPVDRHLVETECAPQRDHRVHEGFEAQGLGSDGVRVAEPGRVGCNERRLSGKPLHQPLHERGTQGRGVEQKQRRTAPREPVVQVEGSLAQRHPGTRFQDPVSAGRDAAHRPSAPGFIRPSGSRWSLIASSRYRGGISRPPR